MVGDDVLCCGSTAPTNGPVIVTVENVTVFENGDNIDIISDSYNNYVRYGAQIQNIDEDANTFTYEAINVKHTNEFVDTGVIYRDNYIQIGVTDPPSPPINPLQAGTYEVDYTVTDEHGNFRTITETVVVSPADDPPLELPEFEVVDYLGDSHTEDYSLTVDVSDNYELGDIVIVNGTTATSTDIRLFDRGNGGKEIIFSDLELLAGNYTVVYSATNDDGTVEIDELLQITNTGDSFDGILFFVEEIVSTVVNILTGGGDGCSDCTPPTFGKNKAGAQIVTGGFAFNNVAPVDVTDFHTDFPLITVITNVTNTATVKIYENQGTSSIAMVQFGLGMPEIGSPLNDAQTLVEISLAGGEIDQIELVDSNNLVDVSNVATQIVKCSPDSSTDCLELSMQYVYRDQPKYNVMAINAMDLHRNSNTNYMNDGILVTGDSINDPVQQDIDVAKANSFYPQKSGLVTLTLVDYKTDMWQDEYGYMWSTDDYGPYLVDDIPRPIQEPDHFSEWSGYNDRLHSEFEDYKQKHTEDIMRQMSKLYSDADAFTTSPDFYLKKHIQHDFEKSNECSDITLKIRDRCDYEQKVEFEIQKAQKVMDMIMDNPEIPYDVQSKANAEAKTPVYESLSTTDRIISQIKSHNEQKIAFAEINLQHNILTVSGNIGQADKTIPAKMVIYYEGDKMKALPLYVTEHGEFSFIGLSPMYEKIVIKHNNVQIN